MKHFITTQQIADFYLQVIFIEAGRDSLSCNLCQAWVQVQGLSQISNKRPGPGA